MNPDIVQGQPFRGSSMGGQQPITSSHLYLFAADSTAYGHASDSLIKAAPTAEYPSHLDSNGNYYIVTDPSSGAFYLEAGQFQCAVGQQIYLYITGGNTGLGQNSAISEMAVLGTCTSAGGFSQLTGNFVYMNEVSTVAAAYALAGFATDATHVASSATALAGVGIQNAFNAAANIYNINGGPAQGSLAATPQGNGTVPQAEVNSLADMLAACINSSGPSPASGEPTSTNCATLLNNATNSSGVAPTETASAMINIAHQPGKNVANLFSLFSNVSPFQPTLSSQPPDYSLILTFANGSDSQPTDLAVDASGNIWITNNSIATVTKRSATGAILSGTGYVNNNMAAPTGIAIDQLGNAWVADESDELIEIPSNGSASSSYTGTDLTGDPQSIAIDANGRIWMTQDSNQAVQFSAGGVEEFATTGGALKNQTGAGTIAIDTANNAFIANYKESGVTDSVSKFSSSGTALSSGTGYGYTLGQKLGTSVAIDASGNFWLTNSNSNSVTIGTNTGSTTVLASGSSSAGVSTPSDIAFDGSGRAWIANSYGTLSVLTSTGAAVTGSAGYSGTTNTTMAGISSIAVDGAGNVWVADKQNGNVYEVLGAATPVVTPLVAGLTSPYTPASLP